MSDKEKEPLSICCCCGNKCYVMKVTKDGMICDTCVIEKDGEFFKKEDCKKERG